MYRILWLSLVRPHKWVRHGHFYLMCRRKQNTQKSQRESNIFPQATNYVFIFSIPVTTFSHTTTARAQYKWRTVEKDREILTRVQQPHVSIWIYLKGRFCYQRGIESTRQHMWKECLCHTKTHFTHTRLMTIQTSEWVYYVLLTARSYGDVDLGLKSNMKGLRSLGSNSWPLGDKTRSFTLHHRGTISQYFILINI